MTVGFVLRSDFGLEISDLETPAKRRIADLDHNGHRSVVCNPRDPVVQKNLNKPGNSNSQGMWTSPPQNPKPNPPALARCNSRWWISSWTVCACSAFRVRWGKSTGFFSSRPIRSHWTISSAFSVFQRDPRAKACARYALSAQSGRLPETATGAPITSPRWN